MRHVAGWFWLVLVLAWPSAADAQSGRRPDPYFSSLTSGEVNVRTGPGLRYPIKWVFQREHLPVEVIDQFDNWRQIRFHTGQEGWVYYSLLSGRRQAVIVGDGQVALRRLPRWESPRLLLAEPGVIVRLVSCRRNWCEADIANRTGWLPKSRLWGAYRDEAFGE